MEDIGQILEIVKANQVAIQESRAAIQETQATLQEFMVAVNGYATRTESEIAIIKEDIAGVKVQLSSIQGQLNTRVVTKDYLDDKLANLKGDLMTFSHKEDTKLTTTIDILTKRRAITAADKKHLLALEPFPQR